MEQRRNSKPGFLQIRPKKEFPGIPVVAITGYGEQPEALALEANADLVLEKPFDLDDLEQSIVNLLSKQIATDS